MSDWSLKFGTIFQNIHTIQKTVHLPSSTHNWKFKLFAGSVSTTYYGRLVWQVLAGQEISGATERLWRRSLTFPTQEGFDRSNYHFGTNFCIFYVKVLWIMMLTTKNLAWFIYWEKWAWSWEAITSSWTWLSKKCTDHEIFLTARIIHGSRILHAVCLFIYFFDKKLCKIRLTTWKMWYFARSTFQRCPKTIQNITKRHVRGQSFNQPLIRTSYEQTHWTQLVKPFLFTVGFTTVTISGCFIYIYEQKLAAKVRGRKNQLLWDIFGNLEDTGPSYTKVQ